MSSKIFRVDQYGYSQADRLLFDANIWLFLYGPQYNPADHRVRVYSAALRRIREVRCEIFIDVLVLSEFVNTYSRFAYNTLTAKTKPKDFKTFRRSSTFRPIAQRIAGDCRRILDQCTRTESGFTAVDTATLLTEYEGTKADLNDLILARLCAERGLTLVTDDADFKGQSLPLLTANSKLLSK